MKSILNQLRRKFTIPKLFQESDDFSETLPYTLSFANAVLPSFQRWRIPIVSPSTCQELKSHYKRACSKVSWPMCLAARSPYRGSCCKFNIPMCGIGTSSGILVYHLGLAGKGSKEGKGRQGKKEEINCIRISTRLFFPRGVVYLFATFQ